MPASTAAQEDTLPAMLLANLRAQGARRSALGTQTALRSSEGQAGAQPPAVPRSVSPWLVTTCWSSARQRCEETGLKPGDKARQQAPSSQCPGRVSSLPPVPAQRDR